MAKEFSKAWDLPRLHELQIQVDGVCYEPLECTNFGGADEAAPDTSDYFCINRKTGAVEVSGTVDNTTPDRTTVAITTTPSKMRPVLEAAKLTRRGPQCYVQGRVAVFCDYPFTNTNLLGWYQLDNWDLGSKSLPQLTDAKAVGNTGGGNAGEIEITFNGTISGIIPVVHVDDTTVIGFENTDEATMPTGAIYQCDGPICKTGINFCNDAQVKRGECDKWYLIKNETATDNFTIWVSTDGGRTYILETSVTNLGDVRGADCDLIVTDQAPLEVCGDSLRQQTGLPPFTDLLEYDGGNAILFSSGANINGVMVYSEALREWFIGQPADGSVTNQNAIDSDGVVMLTGGNSDGLAIGAEYQYSLQAGEVGTWNQATLVIPSFSTITDSIQDVNVRDGVMIMVVNNGTDTRVMSSFDGVNWEEVGSFSGVATFARLRRPSAEITYLNLDGVIWANYSGICECEWKQIADESANAPITHFEVCSNDPTYLHYTY